MKRKKVLSLLLSLTMVLMFSSLLVQSNAADVSENPTPLMYDDFSNTIALDGTSDNALGGHYWGNGIASSAGSVLSLNGTTWLDSTCKADESPVDLSKYSHLVYIVKGSEGAFINDIKLSSKDASGTAKDSASVNMKVTADWQIIKIPLSQFTGANLAGVTKLKADSINGNIYIDKIYFEYDAANASNSNIVTQSTQGPALLFDDFNGTLALDGTSSNALGGHYWGNGSAVCEKSILSLKGTGWLDSTLKSDESPVDLSMYSHLVYVIKSDGAANVNDIKLSCKDASGASVDTASVNMAVSSDWAMVKIPLSKFKGAELSKITKLKADSISGTIYIDKIYFEFDPVNASNPDIITISTQTLPSWTVHKLTYSAPPATNPLKGFIPYSNPKDDGYTSNTKAQIYDQLPYSMEWFYLPLNSVMKGMDKFDWTSMEARLNDIASRGHQAVLRFYVDYPDKPSGIPQFLLDEGLKTHSYVDFNNGKHATSLCPDYNDPRMISALTSFIKAFGKKYDGDPRIGFITEGLVGFWGEWHTWPHDGWTPSTGDLNTEKEVYKDPKDGTMRLTDWMPTTANQDKVLEAFDNAFNITKIQVRQPMGTNGHSVQLDMGYHDDSFAYETLSPDYDPAGGQTWMFWGRMETAGATDNWKKNAMGGEMRPEIQSTIWNYDPPLYHQDNPELTTGGQDFYTCLNVTHATWLLMQVPFTNPLPDVAKARAIEAESKLGYTFYVPKSYINDDIAAGKDLNVGIELDNLGVAPFYYKWKVQIGLKNSDGKLVKTWDTNWDITNILPNSHKVFTWAAANNGIVNNGKYTVVMRVVNPLENLKISKGKAVKLMFANAGQNKDGWLALSTISVTGGKKGK